MPHIVRSDGFRAQGRVVPAGSVSLSRVLGDVDFIRIDHQARLQVGQAQIVIDGSCTLVADGKTHELDSHYRAGLGPLLAVWPDALTSAAAEPDGTLRLTFGRGALLTVPPDPYGEAWQVAGPGTALIVCMMDTKGLLAIWD